MAADFAPLPRGITLAGVRGMDVTGSPPNDGVPVLPAMYLPATGQAHQLRD